MRTKPASSVPFRVALAVGSVSALVGAPGMEVEGRFMPYDVLVLYKDGSSKVYAEVRKL